MGRLDSDDWLILACFVGVWAFTFHTGGIFQSWSTHPLSYEETWISMLSGAVITAAILAMGAVKWWRQRQR